MAKAKSNQETAKEAAKRAAAAAAIAADAAEAAASAEAGEDGLTEEQRVIARVRGLIDGGGDGVTLTALVWRIVPRGDDEYLEPINVHDLGENPMETVRQRHGGGRYKIRFTADGFFVAGVSRFTIAGEPKKLEDPKTADELEEKLEEMLEAKKRDGSGGMEAVLVEMIRANGAVTAAIAAGNQSKSNTTAEVIAAVAPLLVPVLEGLLARTEKGDPLDQMSKMAAILADLRTDDGGIAGIAKHVVPSLTKLVDHTTAQPGPNAPQPSSSPQGTAVTSSSTPPRPAWYNLIAPSMPQFLQWAAAGRDPQLCGDFVAEEIPDGQAPAVLAQLRSSTFFGEVQQHFPQIGPHLQWFDTFLGTIAWNLDPDADDGEPEELEAQVVDNQPSPEPEPPQQPAPEPPPPAPAADDISAGPGAIKIG